MVKNVDGGGSEVGVTEMVRSAPDGYTIGGFTGIGNTCTMREANYHPIDDVEPICLVGSDPRFAVRADDDRFPMPKALLNMPGKTPTSDHRDSGAGTSGHLSILVMNKAAGVEAQPVHFGGAGESRAAFLGGHVDAVAQTYGEVGLADEGKARVLPSQRKKGSRTSSMYRHSRKSVLTLSSHPTGVSQLPRERLLKS